MPQQLGRDHPEVTEMCLCLKVERAADCLLKTGSDMLKSVIQTTLLVRPLTLDRRKSKLMTAV